MYGRTGLLFCVLLLNVFEDSFTSPLREFGDFGKSVDEIFNDFQEHHKWIQDSFRNITRSTGLNTQYLGPGVTNKTTSTTTIDNGRTVTINETVWTNDKGEKVGVYRVIVSKKEIGKADDEERNENPEGQDKVTSEVEDMNKTP